MKMFQHITKYLIFVEMIVNIVIMDEWNHFTDLFVSMFTGLYDVYFTHNSIG